MSQDPSRVVEKLPQIPSFRQRLRLLRNKRYDEWYFAVIGGPISVLLNACIAEVRWITPNGLTLLGFAIRLLALPMALERTIRADVITAGLLMASTILDCMDGGLARYRKRPSVAGAFLDKSTDVISFLLLNGVLGYRAWLDTGSLTAVYAAAFIGMSYASRCYNYWIVAYYEHERGALATAGPRLLRSLSDLGFRERWAYYLGCSRLIIELGEGDIYLWFSLALVLGHLPMALYVIAVGMAAWYLVFFIKRVRAVMRLDEKARAKEPKEAPPAERLAFLPRVGRLYNKQDDDWWAIVFCAPMAAFFNACVTEVSWITPNALTLSAFAVRLGCVPLILTGTHGADVAAALSFTLATILDCMDGGLARYRRSSSLVGAFLDKATDVLGLSAICAALGLRVFHDSTSILGLYSALFIAASYTARCYNYWIVAYFELERGAKNATAGPRRSEQPMGGLGLGGGVTFLLRSTWRILILGESDVYLWLGLGLLLGSLGTAVFAVATGMAFWFVVFTGWRLVTALRLDR